MSTRVTAMKRGEIFSYEAEIYADEVLLDTDVGNIRSQVRTVAGELLGECTVTKVEAGIYTFEILDTNDWPVGDVEFDFDITIDGVTVSSETFIKAVNKDITRPLSE